MSLISLLTIEVLKTHLCWDIAENGKQFGRSLKRAAVSLWRWKAENNPMTEVSPSPISLSLLYLSLVLLSLSHTEELRFLEKTLRRSALSNLTEHCWRGAGIAHWKTDSSCFFSSRSYLSLSLSLSLLSLSHSRFTLLFLSHCGHFCLGSEMDAEG